MTVKTWKENDSGQPAFSKDFKVTKRWEGNCTQIDKNSNKFYHAEIQVANNGSARIFTMYGRVGKISAKEYRYYPSESACLSDFESLIKKKRDRKKDPYREVDLAITNVGSDGAKEIKKPMSGIQVTSAVSSSVLHSEVQRLVSGWFGCTGHFIEMNLKCPLGQLTKEQIDKGREVLDKCKSHIASRIHTNTLDSLTSQFYSLIPHILPHRIDPNSLRLNSIDRIMEKHDMLDTFLDAKNISTVLQKGSDVDEQYKKLNAQLEWLDPQDPVRQWVETLVHETRAKNHHGLGKVKIFNVFKMLRNNELDHFSISLDRIGKEVNGKGEKPRFTTLKRPDLDKSECDAFTAANVWPLWHGTRTESLVGIISRGLLIRPSGVVFTGAMFGSGIYMAESASKSMSYCGCKGAYWSKASDSDRVYMFLNDVIIGNPHIVYTSQFFHKPPRGNHSVYALPGRGLYNSENIVYTQSGPDQQHRLRYIVEFQSNV